jgi:hypothetical protein
MTTETGATLLNLYGSFFSAKRVAIPCVENGSGDVGVGGARIGLG